MRSLINILSPSVWLDCCPLPSNIVELEDVNNLFADELLNRIRLQFDRANSLAAFAELEVRSNDHVACLYLVSGVVVRRPMFGN